MKAQEVELGCWAFITRKEIIVFGITPDHVYAMERTIQMYF